MSNPAQFAAKCQRFGNLVPETMKAANEAAALAVKDGWLRIAAGGGLTPGGEIGGRKWNVRYDTKGTINATSLVRFTGPVHLVLGPTKPHIIGAKKLGTRTSIASKTARLGAGAAFSDRSKNGLAKSNRGVFGAKQIKVNYNQWGSTRQQARKGELRTRRGSEALRIGGGNDVRAYAFHPGTRGKAGIWPACKTYAATAAPRAYKTAFGTQFLKKAGFG